RRPARSTSGRGSGCARSATSSEPTGRTSCDSAKRQRMIRRGARLKSAVFRFGALAALALACLSACRSTPSRPPNIVLIVVDTLRADRVGCYDPERRLTPFIDSLARHAYVFRHAYAQSSWTNPSIATILTSRYQSQHGIVSFESNLADNEVT